MNTPTNTCPQCGSVLSADGLCARCLMAAAAQPTQPSVTSTEAVGIDQLAASFPQLQMIEMIGQGGMGSVFKVRQPKLDRFAALKLLPQSLAMDPAFAGRFEREARLLAKLSHPNIVAVYDYGQAGPFFYLLMEFVDGVNLRQAMRASRFEPSQALGIVPKICEALQYAHDEGVLHRDIKPENILLDSRGRVKLVDFGIAKLAAEADSSPAGFSSTDSTLTQAGASLGTPSYMAPEQRDHPSDVDHRADIYSLGVVFYELLTGELPSGAVAKPSEKSGADPRVDAIVQQALQNERKRRQHSAAEMSTQVQTLGVGSSPPNPQPSDGIAADAGLSPLAVIGAAWAVVFLLFGLAFFSAQVQTGTYSGPTAFQWFLRCTLLPAGLTAPIGTTLLGWLAVQQIRRSSGRTIGLNLAVFDGLVFPLLLLDAGIALLIEWISKDVLQVAYRMHINVRAPDYRLVVALLEIAFPLLIDGLIIKAVWRRAKEYVFTLPAARGDGFRDRPRTSMLGGLTAGGVAICCVGLVVFAMFRNTDNQHLTTGSAMRTVPATLIVRPPPLISPPLPAPAPENNAQRLIETHLQQSIASHLQNDSDHQLHEPVTYEGLAVWVSPDLEKATVAVSGLRTIEAAAELIAANDPTMAKLLIQRQNAWAHAADLTAKGILPNNKMYITAQQSQKVAQQRVVDYFRSTLAKNPSQLIGADAVAEANIDLQHTQDGQWMVTGSGVLDGMNFAVEAPDGPPSIPIQAFAHDSKQKLKDELQKAQAELIKQQQLFRVGAATHYDVQMAEGQVALLGAELNGSDGEIADAKAQMSLHRMENAKQLLKAGLMSHAEYSQIAAEVADAESLRNAVGATTRP